ncbi:serine-rich protein-related [Melia azedarach]|uniref:Serine-rich protein-related n=2 Tax=Melia azedarach TaxID=155640 RepID=A0ACC1XL09_MELAZ|nr:serine-rich protein-related [Melia azedarach]KAJ4711016.1 serine-rich protein-related [Melia azedarach]
MENEEITKHDMKVEIPRETEMTSPTIAGLSRQPSAAAKNNCLCSPTTHAGSFRCRLHRAPTLQRTKSIDSTSASLRDSTSKHADAATNANTVEAQ